MDEDGCVDGVVPIPPHTLGFCQAVEFLVNRFEDSVDRHPVPSLSEM
jgi:hypothetical protein